MADKKYNYAARRIICPLCKTPDIAVRTDGRIWEHMAGRKGLRMKTAQEMEVYSPDLKPYFTRSRSRERCRASGYTELEARDMAKSDEITKVEIPGVISHWVSDVTVLRMDHRYDAQISVNHMKDGTTKMLVNGGGQPYIELTLPKRPRVRVSFYIQWFAELYAKGITNVSQEVLNADNAEVFVEEGATEADCLAQVYKRLFHENWTAYDSISRFDVEELP